MYNRRSCKSDMPHSTIQEKHKSNYNITNRDSSGLAEKVSIQMRVVWHINSINNSVRKTKSRYRTENIAFGSYVMVPIFTTNTNKSGFFPELFLWDPGIVLDKTMANDKE